MRSDTPAPTVEIGDAFENAVKLHQAGRIDEAEQIYRRILEAQPDHFGSLHLLGVIDFQRGKHAEAVRKIDAALELNPNAAEAFNNRGIVLQELKRLDEALASHDQAIALKPDYAEAFNNRGNALLELKRFAEALPSYDKAIALKPDYAEAVTNRGVAAQRLNRLDEALASYDKAIRLDPRHAGAHNNRGNVLMEMRRLNEALASYDKALALEPHHAGAFHNRGTVLRELNRLHEALETQRPSTTKKLTHPSLHSLLDLSSVIKVVDIGANAADSGLPPYAPLLSAGYAYVVGFEPNLEALAELNLRKGANETYLPFAIGDGGRHTLRYCATSGMTSLFEPNQELLSLFHKFSEWGQVVRIEEVDTIRLDDIAETASLDFLKIDIQGAELMVFENAIERLKTALVIHTEVEFLPMYSGQPLFSEVELFLRQHGFVLHRFEPLISRAVKPLLLNNDPTAGLGQLFWADAIFIKDFSRLDRLSFEQLVRLAVILHECYRSYDLVAHLLLECDRRTDAGYGKKFLDAIVTAKTGSHPD